jgi:hypothetical protein
LSNGCRGNIYPVSKRAKGRTCDRCLDPVLRLNRTWSYIVTCCSTADQQTYTHKLMSVIQQWAFRYTGIPLAKYSTAIFYKQTV